MKYIIPIVLCLILAAGLTPLAATAANDETVKVLAVGNSFSVDAVEYLRDIAAEDGVDMLVGNLYLSGCSLQMHWMGAKSNAEIYTFYKFHETNETEVSVSLKEALDSEEWDYVVMQQLSSDSGKPDTYEPYLTNLYNYIKEHEPQAELLLHQTWAYEIDSTHNGFAKYDHNQEAMFKDLKDAYHQASEKLKLRIIPSGEAMQKARSTPPFDYSNGGKSLNRDGQHASIPHGRYLLGAVWYEVLTGNSILGNTFKPSDDITPGEMDVLKQAAHDAAAEYNQKKVTGISLFKKPLKQIYILGATFDITVIVLIALLFVALFVFIARKRMRRKRCE